MAIVIGAATQASLAGGDYCVLSVNWGYNPNVQRLYCLGEWVATEERTFYRPTETLNMTIYAPGPVHSVPPTTECADANTIQASVDPAACGDETYDAFSGDWWVTSYSYTKDDASLPGQESWSLTRWKGLNTLTTGNTIEPTYVMRGIAEGQGTVPESGIVFSGFTVETQTGNVSAGGFGRADTLQVGVVESVGGGSSTAGDTGQGSASIPYTPLYI